MCTSANEELGTLAKNNPLTVQAMIIDSVLEASQTGTRVNQIFCDIVGNREEPHDATSKGTNMLINVGCRECSIARNVLSSVFLVDGWNAVQEVCQHGTAEQCEVYAKMVEFNVARSAVSRHPSPAPVVGFLRRRR